MINTLSNLQGRISLIVKAKYYTCAYGTRAILGLDHRDHYSIPKYTNCPDISESVNFQILMIVS